MPYLLLASNSHKTEASLNLKQLSLKSKILSTLEWRKLHLVSHVDDLQLGDLYNQTRYEFTLLQNG